MVLAQARCTISLDPVALVLFTTWVPLGCTATSVVGGLAESSTLIVVVDRLRPLRRRLRRGTILLAIVSLATNVRWDTPGNVGVANVLRILLG